MLRKMLLAILGCFVMSICFISNVCAGSYDGEWEGKTDQGKMVKFTVKNDIVTSFLISYKFKGTYCSGTAWVSLSGKGTISGNILTDSSGSTEVTGTFISSDTCNGTLKAEDSYCKASVSGTWEATLQTECIPVENDLDLTICAEYQGINYDFTLNYNPVSSDPEGFYWKMDVSTFQELLEDADGCIYVNDDLDLNICAEYEGIKYEFKLIYTPVPSDPEGLYWKMDISTFKIKD